MAAKRSDWRSETAWALARRQHGILTRRQLLALGYSSKGIRQRLRTGRLYRVMQGVYVVGWPQVTRKQEWMAAVLACGDGAVLSHLSAAALWRIAAEGDSIDVSAAREKRRPEVRSRTRPGLPPPRTTIHDSLGLVVETDGLRYHRTAIAQRRDAIRDNEHVASGYTRLRFTHWQVKHEPTYVGAILSRTAANLRRLRSPPLPS